ncbi:MAG: type II toxin-antitoxin system PemK/MazF family toxin [bacterium]
MKDSLVKIKQVSSFDKRRFIKYIGNVNLETMKQINRNLRLFLDL